MHESSLCVAPTRAGRQGSMARSSPALPSYAGHTEKNATWPRMASHRGREGSLISQSRCAALSRGCVVGEVVPSAIRASKYWGQSTASPCCFRRSLYSGALASFYGTSRTQVHCLRTSRQNGSRSDSACKMDASIRKWGPVCQRCPNQVGGISFVCAALLDATLSLCTEVIHFGVVGSRPAFLAPLPFFARTGACSSGSVIAAQHQAVIPILRPWGRTQVKRRNALACLWLKSLDAEEVLQVLVHPNSFRSPSEFPDLEATSAFPNLRCRVVLHMFSGTPHRHCHCRPRSVAA